jgi:hypothetical protein
MVTRIKQYLLILIALAIFFFILDHHFIFVGWNEIDLLKKEKLSLEYTFFSLKQANPTKVMRIETLRDAGIGDVMVERGMVTQQQLDSIIRRIDME